MAQEPGVEAKQRESYRHVDLLFGPHALWRFPEHLSRVYTRRVSTRYKSSGNRHRAWGPKTMSTWR